MDPASAMLPYLQAMAEAGFPPAMHGGMNPMPPMSPYGMMPGGPQMPQGYYGGMQPMAMHPAMMAMQAAYAQQQAAANAYAQASHPLPPVPSAQSFPPGKPPTGEIPGAPRPIIVSTTPPPPEPSSSMAGPARPAGGGDSFARQYPARILLVDDQPLNHKIVTLFLQRLGYKDVQIANNGMEGVQMTNAGAYDIIFMDLQMPVMGGVEAAKEIRGNFLLKNQPAIIAMTGHALSGVKESCMEAGMNDFLTKPVSLDDFRRVIPQCLESAHAS